MASVVVPSGYEPTGEHGGQVCYHDPEVEGSGELSMRRLFSGLVHTPSPQVAAELHLHSGDGSRRWTSELQSTEVDGAPAQLRYFTDDLAAPHGSRSEGCVVTVDLAETLISIRAIWSRGSLIQRDTLFSIIASIRLLALEDLAVKRSSQLHPVFSISVGRPADWKITQMDEELWEFTLPGGTCTLRELDTGEDLSRSSPSEVADMLTGLAPPGSELAEITRRPSATRSPLFASTWVLGSQTGVAAVLLRELPILISASTVASEQTETLLGFVDSLRTHPALY
jgi:hypothetical protein